MDEVTVGPDDWRSNCKSNTERWAEARKKKIFTDVYFLVGEDGNTEMFSAHKNVLSVTSPVFEAMLYGSLAEKKNPIRIHNTIPKAFNNLLRSLYGEEKIAFESVTIAAMTYFLSDQYIVENLRIASHAYLKDAVLHYGNFWELYLNENFLLIPDMEEKCQDYISKNASVLFKSPQLTSLPPNRMEKIVEMQIIDITEFELLRALIAWGSKNVLQSQFNSKLSPLLRSIRFHHLTLDEFMKIHTDNPSLMELKDAMAITKHIQDRKTYMLPAWCSDVTEKRIFNPPVPVQPQPLYFYPPSPNLQSQRIYWN